MVLELTWLYSRSRSAGRQSRTLHLSVAQSVEQAILNRRVRGSSPFGETLSSS